MLESIALSYKVTNKMILNNISFSASAGEFIGVVGPNGAGKSTLLKIVTGVLQAQGWVKLNGKLLSAYTPMELAKQRSVLSQDQLVAQQFTVEQIVQFGRFPYKNAKTPDNDKRIVHNSLVMANMEQFKNRGYHTLSGGERQKVQLARVLAQIINEQSKDVKYLFMDEPLNNLDISSQHQIMQVAKEFAENNHVAIAILHDINIAIQYCHKILFLKDGEIQAFGSPDTIINKDLIDNVFGISSAIFKNNQTNKPFIQFNTN